MNCIVNKKNREKTCEIGKIVVILQPLIVALCQKAYVSLKKLKPKSK